MNKGMLMDKQKTILIADDVSINRDVLCDFFCEDYDTLQAEDGEEAIQLLMQHADSIALLLLDIRMPKKSGFDVLSFMQEHNMRGHIPVMVITGSNDEQDELQAYNLGASDIIHKPFVPQIVLRRAENLMELYEHRRAVEQQLAMKIKELEDAKAHDKLTGLLNTQQFLSVASDVLEKAYRDGTAEQYTVIYSNICNFKYYNARYGLNAGDQMLREIAESINHFEPEDLDARFGNDHFVTLTKRNYVEESIRTVNTAFARKYGHIGVTLKTGIFRIKGKGETVSTACDLAKIACDSIRMSKELLCAYDERLERHVTMSTYVLQNLDKAIQEGYIKAYYQPVLRTISEKQCGMEALARWIDPEIGFLSPADFIPALEENRLITKLDLYMLREICREMKAAETAGRVLVPVSFNLSRYDFSACDIYEEVEKIVREYGVARDMLNIEITETTVMEDPETLRRDIHRFREGGYQVWMDDFGSGYSSLNVLKDFEFDEIKLDMQFLSAFNEKSKKIIQSVILMAKELGIQTLAEGVETQEQLDFLRNIGCEKAQGYLFSKPLPIDQLAALQAQQDVHVEQRGWRGYYNCIGKRNFITDRPLAIVEYDGKDFSYLYINQAFQNVWRSIGATDLATVYNNINSPASPLSKQFRDIQAALHVGDGKQESVYTVRGQYVRLITECLAEKDNRSAFAIEIMNLNNKEIEEKREQMDDAFRMIFTIYDSIYMLDLNTGHFETLMRGVSHNLPVSREFHEKGLINPSQAAELFIHPNDLEEYKAFTDQTTLVSRLKAAKRGHITRFFRTQNSQGGYIWKAHTMIYIADKNAIVYCSRYAPCNQPGLIERIAPEYIVDSLQTYKQGYHTALRQGLMESKNINLFWKDKERRFLGANEKFLATYGFASVAAILGKTDEEMGWHIDDEPFRDEEQRVLENGEVISNHIGRCIIQGVAHNILSSKEPLYDQDGNIIGLVGFFVDMDAVNEPENISVIDQVTGLMSAQGVAGVIAEYAEGWTARKENFAVVRIYITEYHRASLTYGEMITREMLREIGQMIRGTFGVYGSCARLYAGNFAVLMKCTDKDKVRQLVKTFEERAEQVRMLAGYAATI